MRYRLIIPKRGQEPATKRNNNSLNIKSQILSSWSSIALQQLPHCAHPAITGQKPNPALGWFPHWRCAQPCNRPVNYTKPVTMKSLPFPRSHTGEKAEFYPSIIFCLVVPLVMIAKSFFQILQYDGGASPAQRGLDHGGRELWQQHGAACFQTLPVSQLEEQEAQASDTNYCTHIKSIRAERWGERWEKAELRASCLLRCYSTAPAVSHSAATCIFFKGLSSWQQGCR